jgi:hypothetical protein
VGVCLRFRLSLPPPFPPPATGIVAGAR